MLNHRCFIAPLSLLALLALSGCSPHPGAGSWSPIENSGAPFSEIVVDFNGRALLFVPQREEHLYRCFWAGRSSDTLSFDCISADDETLKPQYTFNVSQNGEAELLQATKSMGQYRLSKDQSRHAQK